MEPFSQSLRVWRQTRHLSQAALAGEAGISTRHLSFLETGRSNPTPGMVLRISDALDLPVAGRNELLAAAGFAPRAGRADGQSKPLLDGAIGAVIDMILSRHDPWPAVCVGSAFEPVKANQGFISLGAHLGLDPGGDLIQAIFSPGPLRDAITNWTEFAPAFLRRLQAEARFQGPRSALARKLASLEFPPGVVPESDQSLDSRPPPFIAVGLRFGGIETRWMTTVTTVGSAQDAFLEGLSIEQYFPVDEETRQFADRLLPSGQN